MRQTRGTRCLLLGSVDLLAHSYDFTLQLHVQKRDTGQLLDNKFSTIQELSVKMLLGSAADLKLRLRMRDVRKVITHQPFSSPGTWPSLGSAQLVVP